MFRVHYYQQSEAAVVTGSDGRLYYNTPWGTAVFAWKNIFLFQVPTAVENHSEFDVLDDDIFGENISYGFGSPVDHHWNSIRNFQVKGDIYNLRPRTGISSGTFFNVLTGNLNYHLGVGHVGKTLVTLYDTTSFGFTPVTSPNRTIHAYGGQADLYLGQFSIYVQRVGTVTASIYARFSLLTNIYSTRDGETTFNQWSQVPVKTSFLYQGNTTLTAFLHEDRDVKRVASSTALRIPTVEYGCDEQPSTWISKALDAYRILLLSEFDKISWKVSTPERMYLDPFGTGLVFHSPDFEAIFSRFNRNPLWSELASRAYQGLAFSDINGLAFIKDAGASGAAAISFANTLKRLPTKRASAAAQAYLSVHYGWKLMVQDTRTLYNELRKQSLRDTRKSKCQSSSRYTRGRVTYTARYQVFYNQFGRLIDLLSQILRISDFNLTLENIWDMVPYSFIIDWFLNIGDILSAIDGYATLTQDHEVVAVGRSIKGEVRCLNSMLGLDPRLVTSGLRCTAYFRRYTRELTLPSLLPSVTVNPFNHSVEAAALVISRK